MNHFDVIIIGAGPAGLFASLFCGGRVLILEKGPEPCRKLLISGMGRCNLSNADNIENFFSRYGKNGDFLRQTFRFFSNSDTVTFFKRRGLKTMIQENNKVYPASGDAKDVRTVLTKASYETGALLQCRNRVHSIRRRDLFAVGTAEKTFFSRCVLIATGGMSHPETGSAGEGYRLASSLGHRIVTPVPALTPLIIRDYPFEHLSGVSLSDVGLLIRRDGRRVNTGRGDILFTHNGLSGPAVIDISRSVRSNDTLVLDLVCGMTRENLHGILERATPTISVKKIVSRTFHIPASLVETLLMKARIEKGATYFQLSRDKRYRLVELLKSLSLFVDRPGGFDVAMVTSGGVTLEEVDPKSMQSLLVPGLFFAGEIIDIDGDTGGYNIQAAFSTAALAGTSMKKFTE